MKCLGYKTSQNRSGNHIPSVCPQWEHFHSVIESRDSLGYRLGSLFWHCKQFPHYQTEHASKISELRIKGKDYHNELRDAYYTVSYLFDDIVFCSASVFDYLAQVIFRLNFPERRGRKFWNDLVKEKFHEDRTLGDLIAKIDSDYTKRLSRLRGRSIHTQADIGGLKFMEQFNRSGVSHIFNFTIPQEAAKILPILNLEREDFPIEPGAYLIALQTIASVRDVLIKLGSYEYECQYHPTGK